MEDVREIDWQHCMTAEYAAKARANPIEYPQDSLHVVMPINAGFDTIAVRDWLLDTAGDTFNLSGIYREEWLVGALFEFEDDVTAMLFRIVFL